MLVNSTFFAEIQEGVESGLGRASYGHPIKETPLQYMLMIYDNETEEAALPEQELNAIMAAHGALGRKWRDEGRYVAGDRLQPSAAATTVRMVQGKIVMTDGPYADTKEQLGGFYIIEADDLDQALADASAIPSVGRTIIEVRPVWT